MVVVTGKVTRNPERTKRRILAAARREFAAKGIAGGRVDAIAARAGVNKRMLYHYFESKQGLFRAILRERLAERMARVKEAVTSSPAERLNSRQDHFLQDKEYVRLLMWEALQHNNGRRSAIGPVERRQVYEGLVAEIRADQAVGALPSDLDAAQWALSELALTIFPVAFPQVTELMTGLSVNDPAFAAARRRFLHALANALRPS